MTQQKNQFRSNSGMAYSHSDSKKNLVKYDTLIRNIENQTDDKANDEIGISHASYIHANNHLKKV